MTDRVDHQRTIQEQVSRFAARFRYKQTAVTGRTVQRPIVVSNSRIVIGANWVARASRAQT